MLTSIAHDLIGGAREVSVQAFPDNDGVRFLLQVDPKDLDRVFGPRGRTAASLRIILRAAGIKHDRRFRLSIEPHLRTS